MSGLVESACLWVANIPLCLPDYDRAARSSSMGVAASGSSRSAAASAAGDQAVAGQEAESAASRRDRPERVILLAEDEPLVRKVTERMLTTLGYRVLVAADGAEALALAMAHDGEIDLLLTDVVMPRMDGRSLAEELHQRWPKLKIIFFSGYPAGRLLTADMVSDRVQFISKPFTMSELSRQVRSALADGK